MYPLLPKDRMLHLLLSVNSIGAVCDLRFCCCFICRSMAKVLKTKCSRGTGSYFSFCFDAKVISVKG